MGEVIPFRPRPRWCPVCWEQVDERGNCPLFHLAAHTEPLYADPLPIYARSEPFRQTMQGTPFDVDVVAEAGRMSGRDGEVEAGGD